MSDVGEGTLLQKAPLPHAPSSLPPKTFDLIESLFTAFPVSPKKGLQYGIAPLLKDVPFLQRQAHRKSPFLQKNKIWFPLSYRTETVGEKGGGSGKGERSPSFLRKHQPTTRILP